MNNFQPKAYKTFPRQTVHRLEKPYKTLRLPTLNLKPLNLNSYPLPVAPLECWSVVASVVEEVFRVLRASVRTQ